MALRNNQAPKAKKYIDNCITSNPDNAQVWLMKGNVYVHLYNSDQKKLNADASYTPRYPDALTVANEAFVKALQLDVNVTPKSGMLGALEGQKLCAEPFYEMGVKYAKEGKDEKALEYFTLAAKNYELSRSNANVANSYIQCYVIYNKNDDKENAANMLLKALNSKKDYVDAYVELYYIYLNMNDTVKCGETIEKALKNVPKENQGALSEPLMSYYFMTDQGEKLIELCDTVMAKNPDNIALAAICANYLSNYKYFDKAEEILTKALEKAPNDFNLNEQMGYRFYEEMHAIGDQADALIKEKKFNEAIALRNSDQLKNATQKGYEWCKKAYEINSDHLDNNRHLRELMVKLQMEVPQELNDKINARQQQ